MSESAAAAGPGPASPSQRVWAVVVSHQPDVATVRAALGACVAQVERVLVVDNGSGAAVLGALREGVRQAGAEVLELGDNLGIAAAQNRGIAAARAGGATHVLLLDQDSVPAPDMVARLLDALDALRARDVPVAAVGPRLVDRRSGASTPFVRIGMLGVRRLACEAADAPWIETDFLVSSGTLVSLDRLDAVGLPEEGLFIDNVDLEWSFRARARGLRLYGVCGAVLEHSVGDQVFHLLGRALYRHGPLRQYYIMRNRILLYRRAYSPWGWVVQDFWRMLFKVALFSLVWPPRRQNLRMMWRGLCDGLRGRTGRFG